MKHTFHRRLSPPCLLATISASVIVITILNISGTWSANNSNLPKWLSTSSLTSNHRNLLESSSSSLPFPVKLPASQSLPSFRLLSNPNDPSTVADGELSRLENTLSQLGELQLASSTLRTPYADDQVILTRLKSLERTLVRVSQSLSQTRHLQSISIASLEAQLKATIISREEALRDVERYRQKLEFSERRRIVLASQIAKKDDLADSEQPAVGEQLAIPDDSEGELVRDVVCAGTESRKVTRIIHQSWKTKDVPPRFKKWSNTWKKNHPTYEYRLWSDEENKLLVQFHYPWFLDTYNSLSQNIHRADAARYLYMHKYGGVYADLDMESVKSLHPVFEAKFKDSGLSGDAGAIVAWMGEDFGFEHNIPNAFMASRPGHPFWLHVINRIIKYSKATDRGVEAVTGPVVLYEALADYSVNIPPEHREAVHVLDPGMIFPFDWHRWQDGDNVCWAALDTLDEEKCKLKYNATGKPEHNVYAITYWSHTWEGEEKQQISKWGKDTTDSDKSETTPTPVSDTPSGDPPQSQETPPNEQPNNESPSEQKPSEQPTEERTPPPSPSPQPDTEQPVATTTTKNGEGEDEDPNIGRLEEDDSHNVSDDAAEAIAQPVVPNTDKTDNGETKPQNSEEPGPEVEIKQSIVTAESNTGTGTHENGITLQTEPGNENIGNEPGNENIGNDVNQQEKPHNGDIQNNDPAASAINNEQPPPQINENNNEKASLADQRTDDGTQNEKAIESETETQSTTSEKPNKEQPNDPEILVNSDKSATEPAKDGHKVSEAIDETVEQAKTEPKKEEGRDVAENPTRTKYSFKSKKGKAGS